MGCRSHAFVNRRPRRGYRGLADPACRLAGDRDGRALFERCHTRWGRGANRSVDSVRQCITVDKQQGNTGHGYSTAFRNAEATSAER